MALIIKELRKRMELIRAKEDFKISIKVRALLLATVVLALITGELKQS